MADADEEPPSGPDEDTGSTGRAPRPGSGGPDEPNGPSKDFMKQDDEDQDGFFAELERLNREDELARRPAPEDFGFDEISVDEPADESAASRDSAASRGSAGARRARTGRGRSGRGAGGASAGSSRRRAQDSPFANPRIRLLLGVVVAVVVVVVVVLLVRDYERNQLVDGYTSYVTDSGQIAQASAALGPKLITTMQNTTGQPTSQLQADLRALASQATKQVQQAQGLDVPSDASDANRAFVLALEYRQNGLSALSTNLQQIVHTSDNAAAADTIAESMQQFLASDVIVQDSYLADTAQALRNESITGVSVPSPSAVTFLQGSNINYVVPADAAHLVASVRHVSTESSGQGPAIGLGLVSVVGEPGSITLTPGIAETIPESSDLHWAVTVQNGGAYVENGIKVSASLSYGATPVDVQTNTIATISPGQQVVIAVPGPQASAVKLGTLGLLHVQVATVPGEQNTANNAADYPITLTFN